MKIFLSWSGVQSKAVANLLNEWLPVVVQASKPWYSSKEIESGSRWFSEISSQLSDSSVGIICVTAENKENPWILFESGALSKVVSESKICPLLIDLNSNDVSGPLAQFQHSSPDKEGMLKLLKMINDTSPSSISESVLQKAFETHWEEFNLSLTKIIVDHL